MECFAGDRCCASVIVLVTLSKDHTTLIEQFLIYMLQPPPTNALNTDDDEAGRKLA